MSLSIAKYFILIGGIVILAHQLWLHFRDAEIKTIQKPNTWQQSLSLSSVTFGMIAVVFLMTDFGYYPIATENIANLVHILGVISFALGGGMRIWALHSLGPNFSPDLRIVAGGNLVTGGAYALVRHPYYLSALLLVTGAGLALMNVFVFLLAVLFGFVFRQRIGVEEKMLIEHYGDAYLRYQQVVPMLIPPLLGHKRDHIDSG